MCYKNILIVGCGISGSTVANILANKNHNITIIDKNNHIGGNCYDFLSQDETCFIHKYGPHIFHTKNKEIWDYINQFSQFIEYRHLVYTQYNNKNYIFPINLNTISNVFNTQIYSKEDALNLIHDYHNDNPTNFEEMALNAIGTKLYEMFVKNYTIKQWQTDPKKLSTDIFKRINIRYNFNNDYFENQYQGLPKQGFTNLIANMLNHKNINVILNQQFEYFDKQKFDLIVYTGGFKNLPYRSTKFVHFQDKPNNISVLNTPQDAKSTRITNFNVLHKIKNNYTKHHFCKQIPCNNNEVNQLYPIINKENCQLYYQQKNQLLSKHNNIILCGRLATYQYLDIDKAIEQAIKIANNI